MKRLTINRIASAGLRANRKSYLALAAGIFLSIFLVTALCLCVDGLLARREVRVAESVGYADVVLCDKPATHDQLMQTGYFSRMTELYVSGMVQDSTVAIGYDSPEGAAMLNRRITEGRMPEHAGEIALEPSVLSKLRMEADIGENVTLAIIPVDGTVETRTSPLLDSSQSSQKPCWTNPGARPESLSGCIHSCQRTGACFCHRAHRDSPTGGTASRHDTRTLPQ